MTDLAHDRIASLVEAIVGCMQPGHLPAVDLADFGVILGDDGGRCALGIGVASGPDRVQRAVALAMRDLSYQIQKDQDIPPGS